jgi:hypothetical protein
MAKRTKRIRRNPTLEATFAYFSRNEAYEIESLPCSKQAHFSSGPQVSDQLVQNKQDHRPEGPLVEGGGVDPQQKEDQNVQLVYVEEQVVAADFAFFELHALAAADAVVGSHEHGDHQENDQVT